MLKESNRPKVLFIASNIPTPKLTTNDVVISIAHKLSDPYSISILHPTEFAPFPINCLKKYRHLGGIKLWNDGEIVIHPFKYLRLFGKKVAFLLLPFYNRKVKQYCKRLGIPNLIHAHYALPDGYFASVLKQIYGIPYIISFRSSDVRLMTSNDKSNTMKKMVTALNHADRIIVHNSTHQALLHKLGYDSILLPHGIDADFLKPKQQRGEKDEIVITTIGKLIPRKNIDWVIKAVKNYKGKKTLTLLIAGDGPLKKEIETLITGYPNIKFLGTIKHETINELLCDSDIFALPSINETFGLVYIEATAHQNAVIGTKGTGIWGHFKENEEVLFCDSYSSFQKMLYELIDNDSLRNTIAKNAFDKTQSLFTWDKVIEKYHKIYRDCLT